MRFQILSHAGMLVEAEGIKLVTDPWILGSCYWRSWWNYPKPAALDFQSVNYIYLTHMHWDHFHGPSLRKFPRSVKMLVPKAPTSCIPDDLKAFRFENLIELPHGKTISLAPNLKLTSYQFDFNTDSALVIEDGRTTIIDMNDCKVAGASLKWMMKRHPNVTFMLRSHSSAQPYPFCLEAEDANDLRYRSNLDYVADFVAAANLIKPRYAIPFASNQCFLHSETWEFNDRVVSPLDVKQFFDQHKPKEVDCIVMVAGDAWDDRAGFNVNTHDFFTSRERHLNNYVKEVAPVLENQYRKENAVTLPFRHFRSYFEEMMKSLPRFSRVIFKPVVVFELLNNQGTYWVLDFDKKRVYESRNGVPDHSLLFRVHPAVLKDCLQKKMFTCLFPSKRLRIQLKKGHVRDYFIFEQLFDLYEYRYLPIRRTFNARFLCVWASRWREVIYKAGMLSRFLIKRGNAEAISQLVPRTSV